MRTANRWKILQLKGKALKRKDNCLVYDMETMIEAAMLQFQVLGMSKVVAQSPDALMFIGRDWQENIFNYLPGFEKFMKNGLVRIDIDGPQLAAEYHVRPSGLAVAAVIGSLGLYLLFVTGGRHLFASPAALTTSLLGLFIFGMFFFWLTCYFIKRGMKKELIRSFEVAENLIEARRQDLDISLVEPGHRNLNHQDLARSGFYFRDQGMVEKSRHYFALLLKTYPWTEEATAAFHELRKR